MATPLRSSPVLIIRGWAPGWAPRGPARQSIFRPPIVAEPPPSTADDEHVPRELRKQLRLAGIGVEEDEVLDPDPRFALEVDPRLDREDRRRGQRRFRRQA